MRPTAISEEPSGRACGVLALACALPELCVQLYEASRTGDADRARTLQHRLVPPAQKFVAELGIPGVKYAMDCLGYYGGAFRRPLLPLTEAQKREMEVVLAAVAPVSATGR